MGTKVAESLVQVCVIIIASCALNKRVAGDDVVNVVPDLDSVPAGELGEVICPLINVLNVALRVVLIRAKLEIQVVFDQNIRKRVQSWETDVRVGKIIELAAVGKPELVNRCWAEVMELGR